MELPITVTHESSEGLIDYFNVGTAVFTRTSTILTIGENTLVLGGAGGLRRRLQATELMQRFADLLADSGV